MCHLEKELVEVVEECGREFFWSANHKGHGLHVTSLAGTGTETETGLPMLKQGGRERASLPQQAASFVPWRKNNHPAPTRSMSLSTHILVPGHCMHLVAL